MSTSHDIEATEICNSFGKYGTVPVTNLMQYINLKILGT